MAEDLFVAERKLGVQNVHLVSGEDFIGTVFLSDDEKTLTIQKPVIPIASQDPQSGNLRIGLQPIRPWLDIKELPISVERVIFHVDVTGQMADIYRQFTSDIVIAPAGAIPVGGLPGHPSILVR
jgi:hypothetical protein